MERITYKLRTLFSFYKILYELLLNFNGSTEKIYILIHLVIKQICGVPMNGVSHHNLITLRQNNDISIYKIKYRNTILIF